MDDQWSKATIGCPYCPWRERVEAPAARIDQMLYVAADEHIRSTHWTLSKALRNLPVSERKSFLMAQVGQ